MDGEQPICPWDAGLTSVVRATARQLEEEHVIVELVTDLANARC